MSKTEDRGQAGAGRPSGRRGLPTLDALAERQGVQPVDWEEFANQPTGWPAGESLEEFLEERERSRRLETERDRS